MNYVELHVCQRAKLHETFNRPSVKRTPSAVLTRKASLTCPPHLRHIGLNSPRTRQSNAMVLGLHFRQTFWIPTRDFDHVNSANPCPGGRTRSDSDWTTNGQHLQRLGPTLLPCLDFPV